jgi:dUTP pyrophosphatase
MKVKILKNNRFELPKYKTEGSSGIDLRCSSENPIELKPLERKLIPTGIHMEIPVGYEAQVRARSGLAIKHGISLVNGIGTIDSDYRGEIKVILVNLSRENFQINPGDRIAQVVFQKIEKAELIEVEEINETKRGAGGFGHTGIK